MGVGGRFRGASGTPPPTVCPGMGGDGSLPLIRPCGATFPQGGRQGLLLAAAEGRGGVGAPRPTDGDMETLWGLRGQPFPGRRAVGAGHARPGGWRRQASTVRSVGRGLDLSAGGCPGDGCWREVSRGVGGVARERAMTGACPSSGPAGPPYPEGEGKGCCWRQREPAPTPAAGPRCGAGGSGCSTSGLTKPALYRRNPGKCRGGSRR